MAGVRYRPCADTSAISESVELGWFLVWEQIDWVGSYLSVENVSRCSYWLELETIDRNAPENSIGSKLFNITPIHTIRYHP